MTLILLVVLNLVLMALWLVSEVNGLTARVLEVSVLTITVLVVLIAVGVIRLPAWLDPPISYFWGR